MKHPDFSRFDRSIDLTIAALQRGDHPKVLSLEEFAVELDALAAARKALIEIVEECGRERRRVERASNRFADILRRVATEKAARRAARAKKPKITKEQWTDGVAKIMGEVRRRELSRGILPEFLPANPFDGTRLWDAS